MRPPFLTFAMALALGSLATVPAGAVDLVAIGKIDRRHRDRLLGPERQP